MTKYFNFNNEEHVLPIEVSEDGSVVFNASGNVMTFSSVEELAQNYAVARNVATENLKNWVLVEDGDIYSYVLRAATAGADFFSQTDEDEEDEEYDEYDWFDDEDEELLPYDKLSRDELIVADFFADLRGVDVVEQVNENQAFLDLVQSATEDLQNADYGDVAFNVEILKVGNAHENGCLSEKYDIRGSREQANKALQVAALARREFLPIVVVNMDRDEWSLYIEPSTRPTNEPFRETELVLNLLGKTVVFER